MKRHPDIPQFSYPVIPSEYRTTMSEPIVSGMSELREFYDPANLLVNESDEALLAGVAATRQANNIVGIGQVNGYETIIAETLHAQLNDVDDLPIPVSAERREEIVVGTIRHADTIARSVWEVASEIIDKYGDKPQVIGDSIVFLPRHIVLSGKVLAMVAHQRVRRRSGRDYYMHPDEASSTLSIAWYKQGLPVAYPGEEPSELAQKLDVFRFLTYGHDAFEDTLDRTSLTYGGKEPPARYLADEAIMTPLVAEHILAFEGLADARTISRALLGLTRTRDVAGNRMDYNQAYIPRGIRIGGEYYVLPKAADMNHNLSIEPDKIIPGDAKTRAKLLKREMYKDGAVQLLRASEAFDDAISNVVHSIFVVTPQEVALEARRKYSLDIERIANRVRVLVTQRLHGAGN